MSYQRSNETRPTRIDVFVDGSWLFKGKRNTTEAGGWGAVVIESYKDGSQEAWMPHGPTAKNITSSGGAEAYAAIRALKAVKLREAARPGVPEETEIVLHSDQKSWETEIQKWRADPQGKRSNQDNWEKALARTEVAPEDHKNWKAKITAKPEQTEQPEKNRKKNGDANYKLMRLLIAMDVKVEYTSHNKASGKSGKDTDDAIMDIPHQLAAREAWATRAKNQKGVLHFGPDTITIPKGEEGQKIINRIFHADTDKIRGR